MNRRTLGSLTCLPLALVLLFVSAAQGAQSVRRAGDSVPDDFPRFVVPGHEREMSLLRELYWLHDQPAGPLIPLWDEWMPMSTLWPARRGAATEFHAWPLGRRVGRPRNECGGLCPHAPARRAGACRGLAVPALAAGRRHRLAFRPDRRSGLRRPTRHARRLDPHGRPRPGPECQGLADRVDGRGRDGADALVRRRGPRRPLAASELVGQRPGAGQPLRRVDGQGRAPVQPRSPPVLFGRRRRRARGPRPRRNPQHAPHVPPARLERRHYGAPHRV